jgi:hypothetical protein
LLENLNSILGIASSAFSISALFYAFYNRKKVFSYFEQIKSDLRKASAARLFIEIDRTLIEIDKSKPNLRQIRFATSSIVQRAIFNDDTSVSKLKPDLKEELNQLANKSKETPGNPEQLEEYYFECHRILTILREIFENTKFTG